MDEGTFPLLGVIVEVKEQVYRIARMSAGRCGVVRVADNTRVGTFSHANGELQVTAPRGVDALCVGAAKVGISLLLLAAGFQAVSDDDYARIVKGRAISYWESDETYRQDMPFENVHGNGGLLTTVGDLLRWNANFDDPKVGDADLLRKMQVSGRLTNDNAYGYGLGLSIDRYKGLPEIRHSGTTASYRAYLSRFPDQKLSVAVRISSITVPP